MNLPPSNSDSTARTLQLFDHIDDLIQKGSLTIMPTSLTTEHAESWVVYTNGITVTVTLVRRAGIAAAPPHIHDVKSVMVVTMGGFDFQLAERTVRVPAGETITVPAGILHMATALEDNSKLVSVYMPREPIISKLFGRSFKPHA